MGDKCVNIVDHAHRQERLQSLQVLGIDVDRKQSDGQLELLRWEQAHVRNGRLDQFAMLKWLDDALIAGSSPRHANPSLVKSRLGHATIFGVEDLVE